MILFVLVAAMLAVAAYAIVYGIARLATRWMHDEERRVALLLVHVALALASIFYAFVVWGILKAHWDTRDFWSPSAQSRLEFWSEACRTGMAPGTPVEDVLGYLEGQGVKSYDAPDRRARRSYRYSRSDDWLQVEVKDLEVRNWNAGGDLHVYVNVRFTGERVAGCKADIVKHGL